MNNTAPSEDISTFSSYQVIARKYRPKDFNHLIGQEPMVQTIRNAFITGRIAHAWILSGVRGVGKTTTARILARALNYKTEKKDYPSIDFEEEGEHCAAIIEGYHVDVIEMDAASHTGIDDIREIIENIRYAPSYARFKVYIIDEVHMLSTQAFNGLLKTLEEPPAHAKFILATTEIKKVPTTILSRCQRFDLRRIDSSTICQALKEIAIKEKVDAEDRALNIIAKEAKGSMRDAQSILDQAILHSSGCLTAETVQNMLGLANHVRIIDLFEYIIKGDIAKVLEEFRAQYKDGAEPLAILTDLSEFTYFVTRIRFVENSFEDLSFTQEQSYKAHHFATMLSLSVLSRMWQMLLKAITETQDALDQNITAQMALIRITHAANLPSLEDALHQVEEMMHIDGKEEIQNVENILKKTQEDYTKTNALTHIASLEDILFLAQQHQDIRFKVEVKQYVHFFNIQDYTIYLGLREGAPDKFAYEVSVRLKKWTNQNWAVEITSAVGKTLAEKEKEHQKKLLEEAEQEPFVRDVLKNFPGAQVVDVRGKETVCEKSYCLDKEEH